MRVCGPSLSDRTFHADRWSTDCLIVQVKDHRSDKSRDPSSTSDNTESNVPFSIHNYQQWVTPSPYVPYPDHKSSNIDSKDASEAQDAQRVSASAEKGTAKEPSVYTVVLFPTPLSLQEDAYIQANTPDLRPGNRRTQGATGARTPASATATVPPTPLSAIPPAPFVSGSAAKRQRMSITGAEIHEFESKIVAATAPPLFLDSVSDLDEAHLVLQKLTDPLHREKHPSPKTRKRTVAELAADERIAAQEQAFMLIMDEKAGPNLAKASSNDDSGTASFQPRFERFNAIQQIKAQHEDQARLLAQQKQRHEIEIKQREAQLKQQRERMAQQERIDKEHKAQMMAHQQAQLRAMQQKDRASQIRQQQQVIANKNHMAHAQANGIVPNGYSQAQHSSPIIRNSTPVLRNSTPHSNASPVLGNMTVSQAGGVPMQATSSGQGSSPGRPPSSMQHGHPAAGGINMVHQRSRQQHPSRTGTPQMNGTPHMPNATSSMPHATPIMGVATPTSHVPQGSPQNVMHTPAMGQHTMPNQRGNGANQMTQEQYQNALNNRNQQQVFQLQQRQMLQQQHQQQQARQMQQSPPQVQMSPEAAQLHNMQQLATRQQQEAAYRQRLHSQQSASMNGVHGHATMPNGASPHPPPQQTTLANQHPAQQTGQPRPIAQIPTGQQVRQHQIYTAQYTQILGQLVNQHGGNPTMVPKQQKEEAQRQAMQNTKEILSRDDANLQNKTLQERQRQHMLRVSRSEDEPIRSRAILIAPRQFHQMRAQAQQNGQANGPQGAPNMGMQNMGFPAGGAQGQGLTREQIMAQMGQMTHVGAGGMNGMNGMQ